MKRARLSTRLLAIADMISEGGCLCDVGCDHAYLSIYLAKTNRINKAISVDIAEGPLAKAKENVMDEGLSDIIELRLSDGLSALLPGEADSIVMAGMGGTLIIDILDRGFLVAKEASELVLSPQSETESLRRFLRERGVYIIDEDFVSDRGKYYPIIKAALKTGHMKPPFDRGLDKDLIEACDAFGPLLLQNRNPVLFEYLNKELLRLNKLLPVADKREDSSAKRIKREYKLAMAAKSLFMDER